MMPNKFFLPSCLVDMVAKKRGGSRPGAGRPTKKQEFEHAVLRSKETKQEREKTRRQQKKHEEYIDELKNPSGKARTLEENKMLLLSVFKFVLRGGSIRQAIEKTSEHLCCNKSNLYEIVRQYEDDQSILVTSNEWRGRASEVNKIVTPTHVKCLQRFIVSQHSQGLTCSIAQMIEHLNSLYQVRFNYTQIRRALIRAGYIWNKMESTPQPRLMGSRVARIRRFLFEYSRALGLEKRGTHVIVYMDETYCHTNLASKYSWFCPDIEETTELIRASGQGLRLIVVHAMTRDGMLVASSNDGKLVSASDNVDQVVNSSELVFEGKSADADYHKSMNGKLFMKWLENRLFPSFRALYGDKKMILVLDNASFHHHRGDNYISVHNKNKGELESILVSLGVTSMTVPRNGAPTTYDQETWKLHGGPQAPTAKEMKERIEVEIQAHPDLKKTEVQKLFDQNGFSLVYTPPYSPAVQPIETVWAIMKQHVAKKYTKGRNAKLLRQHIQEGFYGTDEHKGVSSSTCESLLSDVIKHCNGLIECDDMISGNIFELTSKATSSPPEPIIEEDELAEHDEFDDYDEDDDNQIEEIDE